MSTPQPGGCPGSATKVRDTSQTTICRSGSGGAGYHAVYPTIQTPIVHTSARWQCSRSCACARVLLPVTRPQIPELPRFPSGDFQQPAPGAFGLLHKKRRGWNNKGSTLVLAKKVEYLREYFKLSKDRQCKHIPPSKSCTATANFRVSSKVVSQSGAKQQRWSIGRRFMKRCQELQSWCRRSHTLHGSGQAAGRSPRETGGRDLGRRRTAAIQLRMGTEIAVPACPSRGKSAEDLHGAMEPRAARARQTARLGPCETEEQLQKLHAEGSEAEPWSNWCRSTKARSPPCLALLT